MNASLKADIDNLVAEVDLNEWAIKPRPLKGDAASLLVEMALQLHPAFDRAFMYWEEQGWPAQREAFADFHNKPHSEVKPAIWKNLHTLMLCSLFCYSDGEQTLETFRSTIERDVSPDGLALATIISVVQTDPEGAIQYYRSACEQSANNTENFIAPGHTPGLSAFFYALAVIKHYPVSQSHKMLNELCVNYRTTLPDDRFVAVLQTLADYAAARSHASAPTHMSWLEQRSGLKCPWLVLVRCTCLHWLQIEPSQYLINTLRKFSNKARDADNFWYRTQANELLVSYGHEKADFYYEQVEGWLPNFIEPHADWHTQLQQIESISRRYTDPATAKTTATEQLVWWCFHHEQHFSIQPRVQKRAKNGSWTKGRKLTIFQWESDFLSLPFVTSEEKALYHALERDPRFYFSSNNNKDSSNLHTIEQIRALAKIDNLLRVDIFDDVPMGPMTIELQQPCLEVIHHDNRDDITIQIKPALDLPVYSEVKPSPWHMEWAGQERLMVTCFEEGQQEIFSVLGTHGIEIPAESVDRVLETLKVMAPMINVLSNVRGTDQSAMTMIGADTKPHMELSPWLEGLSAQLKIYPLGPDGPEVLPGEGYETMLSSVDGNTLTTNRHFAEEVTRTEEVLSAVPLQGFETDYGRYHWEIEDPVHALELLDALQNLGDDVVISWPRGQRIATPTRVSGSNMSVKVSSEQSWMQLEGELQIGEDRILNMDALLRLLNKSRGRFIKLDDGGILALSKRLHSQLNAIQGISDDGMLHPLATATLDDSVSDMIFSADANARKRLDLLHEAQALEPSVPATLNAQLRDYQLEGFQWLVRLSHWSAGACLADDMGLGKTVQSLALLLHRADKGPALVVAPTSLCYNWEDEAQKFADSLNVKRLGQGDREALIASCKPGDLLICSYGILQNEIEALQNMQWATVVADEAQAFKNSNTRRSKAMMLLKADFRMITTGTPIENHLGELWNLFRFINPGLLGSREKFNEKFANPIEVQQNVQARDQLKALLRPFILRRLKKDVLTELPARTEITQLIELSTEETAFYEAIRRQSIERINLPDEANDQRFKLLAEITRLRQACCHPKLIIDNPPVESAKLKAFAKIVDELRENGHRTLVFSQFVGHLTLIRGYLDNKKITYQYLDGSTSPAKRKTAVDKFQNGEGELFLISLKAGGSGLNLTAADYVIHMDPWWNPAVEDQASDRAHRMGQTRPVTIYRLVVKNTIEEKIVALHAQKRDLADGLLEGTDSGVRLSVEDLKQLLAEV